MRPVVSIIVPVYKVEAYLDECIESIVSQTYTNVEIILVDDGSPDRCPEMCDEWARKDERINVIHQLNQGLSGARNVGIAKSKGQYLAFVDSDDYIDCHMIEYSMNAFGKSNADIVVFDLSRVSEQGEFLGSTETLSETVLSQKDALEALLSAKIHDYPVNKVYKREVFQNVSFPEGRCYEDIGTTYKTFLNAEKIYCLPEKLYYYRKRKNSIIGTMSDKALLDLYEMRKTRFEDLYQIDPLIAEKGFDLLAVSALRFYDRSLWSNVDQEVLKDAQLFLSQNKEKILQATQDKWLLLYMKHPNLYRFCRLSKHWLGNILKKIRRR